MNGGPSLTHFSHTAERVAQDVITSYSTSFGLATRLLGRRHRAHVRNVYALVRVADEIVDGVAREAGLTFGEQLDALNRYAEETRRAMQTGYSTDLVVHAFAHTARESGIDARLTEPFFDSMRTDLTHSLEGAASKVFDRQAHSTYVYGSAEVVGLMCLRIFSRDETLTLAECNRLEHGARQLGAAFQNINFLRDLADDTNRLGRHYLGTGERLTTEQKSDWVTEIRTQLTDAAAVLSQLPRDARTAVRSALALFAALTDRIDDTPVHELYRKRVRVPNSVKYALAARAVLATAGERQS